MMDSNLITRLQDWYSSACNGDWEHTYGITVNTIDNPGWSLRIELVDTLLYEKKFAPIKIQRVDKDDWVSCSIKDGIFEGFGGSKNLAEILRIFLNWAEDKK